MTVDWTNLEDIEENLDICVFGHLGPFQATYADLPGVSIDGYGDTPLKAKYTLLLRTLATAPSHMDKVLERLGIDPGELNLRADFEFLEDGSTLIHLVDPCGRKQTVKGPRTEKRER